MSVSLYHFLSLVAFIIIIIIWYFVWKTILSNSKKTFFITPKLVLVCIVISLVILEFLLVLGSNVAQGNFTPAKADYLIKIGVPGYVGFMGISITIAYFIAKYRNKE
jgi:hypothetical protein